MRALLAALVALAASSSAAGQPSDYRKEFAEQADALAERLAAGDVARRAQSLGELGRLRLAADEHEKAVSVLEEALALSPEDRDVPVWLAYAYCGVGRHADADAMFEAMFSDMHRDRPDAFLILAGNCRYEGGDLDAAIATFREAESHGGPQAEDARAWREFVEHERARAVGNR